MRLKVITEDEWFGSPDIDPRNYCVEHGDDTYEGCKTTDMLVGDCTYFSLIDENGRIHKVYYRRIE